MVIIRLLQTGGDRRLIHVCPLCGTDASFDGLCVIALARVLNQSSAINVTNAQAVNTCAGVTWREVQHLTTSSAFLLMDGKRVHQSRRFNHQPPFLYANKNDKLHRRPGCL